MNNETNISRNSQIDILRALSMFMIIICHFIYHGIRHVVEEDTFPDLGFSASLTGEINFFFCQLLGYLTNIGPNLFVLITGYFLIKPRKFRYATQKALHLWLVTVFYSLTSLLVVSLLTSGKVFSYKELIDCLLPLYSRQYWFMSMYIPLLLLSPFLATGASALEKRDYQRLLLVLFILNFVLNGIGYGALFQVLSRFLFIFLFFLLVVIYAFMAVKPDTVNTEFIFICSVTSRQQQFKPLFNYTLLLLEFSHTLREWLITV